MKQVNLKVAFPLKAEFIIPSCHVNTVCLPVEEFNKLLAYVGKETPLFITEHPGGTKYTLFLSPNLEVYCFVEEEGEEDE